MLTSRATQEYEDRLTKKKVAYTRNKQNPRSQNPQS